MAVIEADESLLELVWNRNMMKSMSCAGREISCSAEKPLPMDNPRGVVFFSQYAALHAAQ